MVTHALCMQEALERGFDDYDFLVGDKQHKDNLSHGRGDARLGNLAPGHLEDPHLRLLRQGRRKALDWFKRPAETAGPPANEQNEHEGQQQAWKPRVAGTVSAATASPVSLSPPPDHQPPTHVSSHAHHTPDSIRRRRAPHRGRRRRHPRRLNVCHVSMSLLTGGWSGSSSNSASSTTPHATTSGSWPSTELGLPAEDLRKLGFQVDAMCLARNGKRAAYRRLKEILVDEQIDIIHTHNTCPQFYGASRPGRPRFPAS